MDLLGGGCASPQPRIAGCLGVPFFIIKKKKGKITDCNLSNTANT